MFNSYFGTEMSPANAKTLISSIKTNNLTAGRAGEDSSIGICYVQNLNNQNAVNKPESGMYTVDSVDKTQLIQFFSDKNFVSDYDSINNISNEIKNGTTYTINIANSKVATDDNSFLNNDVQLGTTGGYYKTGYIRLIYIIDNSVIK